MPQMIFLNLPVADIARARAFYAGLGFGFDERFCDNATACVRVSDEIHFMIMERERFAAFAPRAVADTSQVAAALICLSRDSRAEVEAFVARALAHGGSDNGKTTEMGDFMYGRSVSDPDGNILEPMWMDVDAAMRAWGQAA